MVYQDDKTKTAGPTGENCSCDSKRKQTPNNPSLNGPDIRSKGNSPTANVGKGQKGNLEGIEEIEKQIASASARAELRKHLEMKLQQTRQTLQSERNRLAEARTTLMREEKDVKQLESLTLTSILYSLAGRKDEKLDKEQQEFLAAKLRYDNAASAVTALEADIEALAREFKQLGDPQEDLARALHAKEQFLLSTDDPKAEKLIELQESHGRLSAWRQELREAVSAGEHVHRELQSIVKILDSAQSWGMWDMLGGGILATGVKHSKMEEARRQIHVLQQSVRKFNRELADLDELGIDLHLSEFETFADYFFDGLIIDWLVQSKINRSLEQAEQQLNRVNSTVRTLRGKLRDTEAALRNLAVGREELLRPK